MKHTISILVENEFGVLSRIASLFSAKGYNIDSLSVSETLDPTLSRMTIVTHGSDAVIEQIIKQLNKLINVITVEDLTQQKFVTREMLLVKIKRGASPKGDSPEDEKHRLEIDRLMKEEEGRIVDQSKDSTILEFTGDGKKIRELLDRLGSIGLIEFARTGNIALERGTGTLEENR